MEQGGEQATAERAWRRQREEQYFLCKVRQPDQGASDYDRQGGDLWRRHGHREEHADARFLGQESERENREVGTRAANYRDGVKAAFKAEFHRYQADTQRWSLRFRKQERKKSRPR